MVPSGLTAISVMTFTYLAKQPVIAGNGGAIDFHFCRNCGCVTHYVATRAGEDGRHWTAVNLRLTEPKLIAHLPIDHFDGLSSFDDLQRDGRCVVDMWF